MKKVFLGVFSTFLLLLSAMVFKSCSEGSHKVRNVIVMIGDGMGLSEIAYTDTNSSTPIFIDRAEVIGLVRTHSLSHRVTDSAAAATAFACGEKSNNGVIGMDGDLNRIESILERCEREGAATGVVATYSVTHATPAGFLAHNPTRHDAEGIARDIVESGVDLFIAGGRKFFERRSDSIDLSAQLRDKGYSVLYDIESVESHTPHKMLAAMLADDALPSMINGRGDMLPRATRKALEVLQSRGGDNGLFLMVEGSQIDGMGHKNCAEGIFQETIDFDQAVQAAFDFADRNPSTLVVVFADHETGGLTLPSDGESGIEPRFSTGNHTGIMVPIYAYGDCSDAFSGVMDNTDIPKRIATVMGIEW